MYQHGKGMEREHGVLDGCQGQGVEEFKSVKRFEPAE